MLRHHHVLNLLLDIYFTYIIKRAKIVYFVRVKLVEIVKLLEFALLPEGLLFVVFYYVDYVLCGYLFKIDTIVNLLDTLRI